MTTQPEALRLAVKLKSYSLASGYAWHCHKAADELRRLYGVNQELLEALQEIVAAADGDGWNQLDASFKKARAAIAQTTGKTT